MMNRIPFYKGTLATDPVHGALDPLVIHSYIHDISSSPHAQVFVVSS